MKLPYLPDGMKLPASTVFKVSYLQVWIGDGAMKNGFLARHMMYIWLFYSRTSCSAISHALTSRTLSQMETQWLNWDTLLTLCSPCLMDTLSHSEGLSITPGLSSAATPAQGPPSSTRTLSLGPTFRGDCPPGLSHRDGESAAKPRCRRR